MALGYTVKKGIFILNEEGQYDEIVKANFSKNDNVISGDYTKIRSLSEKAHDMLEKERRKREKRNNKNSEVYKEIKENIDYKGFRHERVIDYSQAVGRKDYFGHLNRETPKTPQENKDIVFELHKEVVVDYGSYNLKELVDFTLNILDNILNGSNIPSTLKCAVNNALQAIIHAFSINSISKWISFMMSVQKILGMVVDSSETIKTFVNRLSDLTKVSENSYKDCDTINEIYSNAFGDLLKWTTHNKSNNRYKNFNVKDILNAI